jgi:hypothetical protein
MEKVLRFIIATQTKNAQKDKIKEIIEGNIQQ